MRTMQIVRGAALAAALGVSAFAQAQTETVPIQFNPDGTGAAGAVSVHTFDWAPNSALALKGTPAPAGLVTNSKFVVLSQASLAVLLNSNGLPAVAIPAGTEFTFVSGFPETVTSCTVPVGSPPGTQCTNAALKFDDLDTTSANFFEIWVTTAPPLSDNLAGTGFAGPPSATNKRILLGRVVDASGNFATGTCPGGGASVFDLFNANDWPGQTTICGSGSTQIRVSVTFIDDGYFPGFTPEQKAKLVAEFNTSTVVPFRQADPSRLFIGNDAGCIGSDPGCVTVAQPAVVPNLAAVNGVAEAVDNDFELQSDANQAFRPGIDVPGACRVTYGGNDRNGNVSQNTFGAACAKDKGNTENCYTFGGQVGAPTANPALGGPFGEHTHHQVSGPAGDFVFHAGTHSSLKTTRITATRCEDPGACRQAEANASFKQIDFEGTGSFRTLSATATAYLKANGGGDILPDHASDRIFYFRVDMDDFGEPGNKSAPPKGNRNASALWANLLAADLNKPLNDPDPLMSEFGACNDFADVYQFYICKDANSCEEAQAIYKVRGFLTGGNIQLHKVIK